MSTSYEQHLAEDRRLVILRILEASNGYTANGFVLQQMLQPYGHSISHDKFCAELEWLREQGLITIEKPGEITLAKLTTRGADVARGVARVPGVKRAEPGQ